MKREFFMKAIGGIDDDLICEANAENKTARKKTIAKNTLWRTFGGIAAAIVIACGVWTAIEMNGMDVFVTAKDEANHAPDAAYPAEGDNAGRAPEFADGDYYYTADDAADTEAAHDTSVDMWLEPQTHVWYFICQDGVWSDEEISFPDGVPSAEGIANAYLAHIGAEAKCLSVEPITVGEQDMVVGDTVVHTVGVRTVTVVLAGTLTEDELRGLIATVGNFAAAHYVRPVTADGTLYPLNGEAPEEGYKTKAVR